MEFKQMYFAKFRGQNEGRQPSTPVYTVCIYLFENGKD